MINVSAYEVRSDFLSIVIVLSALLLYCFALLTDLTEHTWGEDVYSWIGFNWILTEGRGREDFFVKVTLCDNIKAEKSEEV